MNLNHERPDILMMRIQHAQAVSGYKQMKKHNLHPKQIPILLTLKDNEGISQNELAKKLHVKPPTIAVSVKRLSASGYIVKEDDENDARISHLHLTEMAKKEIEEIQESFNSSADKMLAGFTEEEKAQFTGYLRRILDNVGQVDSQQMCCKNDNCDIFTEEENS